MRRFQRPKRNTYKPTKYSLIRGKMNELAAKFPNMPKYLVKRYANSWYRFRGIVIFIESKRFLKNNNLTKVNIIIDLD